MSKREKIIALNLKASGSYWQATEEEVDAIAGGCGPGGIGDYLVPDTVWGLNIVLACRIHDYMYWECKGLKSLSERIIYKKLADEWFLENMFTIIDSGWKLLRKCRRKRAITYYWFVVQFGDSSAGVKHKEKGRVSVVYVPRKQMRRHS